ncbi:MAG: N-acetylglucosamine-6-phosphate deacetylase [Clostridiales bacterium]|nr:N-acetylglucosamine-6-phosphate deacetylase [Clostridiales bacterium]
MKAIINGRIVMPYLIIDDQALLFDRKILGMVPADALPEEVEVIDAKGAYVTPGLVDMHIHGYMGEDASDGKYEGLVTMANGVAKNGVTAFLPTTMTVSYDDLRKAYELIRRGMRESLTDAWQGAAIVGCNSEGPFINASKKGAQAGEHVKVGDAKFLKEYQDVIKVFTIAPEVEGNLDCIREIARDTDMLISMGHTAANFEQAKAGIEAGVRHVTHLFNAQTGLLHRDPGVVGAALVDERVSCELIADTFHVNKALFQLVADMKQENMVLITDCTRAGGMPDGEYTLGGQPIFVKGIECRLADGTIAGSVLKLNEAVRNVVQNTNWPLEDVINMASLNPATRIGIADRKGSLDAGKDADIAIMDEDFNVQMTILGGRVIYRREA